MNADKNIHITAYLLSNLENSGGLIDLVTEHDFFAALKLERAIIYLLVDWSGPERASRYVVYSALNEIGYSEIPFIKIDCSDLSKQYVMDWLLKQGGDKEHLYSGGWGETLLVCNGDIIDAINNPARLGLQETKNKIYEWISGYR